MAGKCGKNITKRWFPEDVGKPKTTYMRYMYPNLDVWCIILYIWLSFVSSKCSEIYSLFFSLGLIGFDQLTIQGPMPMQDRTVSNNNSKRRFEKCLNCKKQLHGTSNRKMNEEHCLFYVLISVDLVCIQFASFHSNLALKDVQRRIWIQTRQETMTDERLCTWLVLLVTMVLSRQHWKLIHWYNIHAYLRLILVFCWLRSADLWSGVYTSNIESHCHIT